MPSVIHDWFARRHREPTPIQAAAWPVIAEGRHVLIVSPTGTGKTLAAFLGVLDSLAQEHAEGRLGESLRCLYLSPLRALGYDLAKNLQAPLQEVYGDTSPVRIGLRSGDTPPTERQRQFDHPPHLLLTTPESLCLMLSQEKWLPKLATVRWVIVDELHALAENKRGTHLTLTLERLEEVIATSPSLPAVPRTSETPIPPARQEPSEHPAPRLQRIGLSATVHPREEAAAFLGGVGRKVAIIEAPSAKRMDLRVSCPLQREPYPKAGFSGQRLIRELAKLVSANRTTLVFSNTRSGAESATYWLKEQLPALADRIECHHASLDRELRLDVEDRLKRGELRAVVCSTSLELGIDIGSIDLVVLLATPKGVARALQRVGRAGHSIREVSRGLLMATNVGDLVECCATALLARAGHLDRIRIPEAPLDVLAQHLMSLACTGMPSRDDAYQQVRRAHPYRNLSRTDFDAVLDFLAGGGESLRRQYTNLFGKIHLEAETFEVRSGPARRDFLQNIGTISGEGVVQVVLRNTRIGSIEEGFFRRLKVGDVFALAGRALRVERAGAMECFVARADGSTPTVPRWGANKFPLANRVAREIRSFRGELREHFEAGEAAGPLQDWIARRLDCGATNAAVIHRVHAAQHGMSEIPTGEFLLVESFLEIAEPDEAARPKPAAPRRRETPPPATEPGQLAMAGVWLDPKARSPASRGVPSSAKQAPAPASLRSTTAEAPTLRRHCFFHALIGRAANDALGRVIGLRLARRHGGNAVATADDYGFVLTVGAELQVRAEDLPELLSPDGFQQDLQASLQRSDLLKYHFRNAAQTGLMVYRNYFGTEKSVRKVQWSAEVIFNVLEQHEPEHVLLREARRDALHTFLDGERAEAFLRDLQEHRRPLRLREVPMVSPLAFGMYATKIREALMVEDPQETLERLYHHWWAKLEGTPAAP
ncbi:MAG: DEAD/DEAH box helicase [Verrucomicrobiota bacterium]